MRIAFPTAAAFHRATVFGLSRVTLETAIAKVFGKKLKLIEETNASVLEAAPTKSIAEEETTVRQTRERSIEAKVREHPAVKSLTRLLGGTVEHIQVLEPAPKELAPKEGVEDES